MRKVTLLGIMIAVTLSLGPRWSSAQTAAPTDRLLDVLPDGSGAAVIDFQRILGSSLWAALNTQEKLKSAIDKAQTEISELGVQLSDVNSVAVVFPAAGMDNPTIAVSGRFEQNALIARLRASGKVKLTVEKYKDFDIYRAQATASSKESSPAKPAAGIVTPVKKNEGSFVFIDPNTIVTGSAEAVRASVDVKTGSRPGILQNAKLAEALVQNPTAAIRFAVSLTPAMTSGLQSSELPIPDFSSVSLIFGAIDLASSIELTATLRSDTADHAKAIAERLTGLLAMATGYLGAMSDPKMASIAGALKTINITPNDVDVRITGSVSMDLLGRLFPSSTEKK
ncbi:MAG: hypothetical protein WAV20_10285 [Blastocatellia bacterium]